MVIKSNQANREQRHLIIGAYGRSCSGKDSIVQRIASVNKNVLHINMDIFFKSKTECHYGKNRQECWEHTDVIWFDHLYQVISALKNSKRVTIKDRSAWYGSYDCKILPRDLNEPRVIIVQGYLLFTDSRLVNLFDGRVFLDVSNENIIKRNHDRRENYNSDEYIKEVVIPVSEEEKYANQSQVADKNIDTNTDKLENVTNCLVEYINTKFGKSLNSPIRSKTWEVKEGDLLSDHEWHPLAEINMGIGNAFEYRKICTAGNEVRLSQEKSEYRHIFHYTSKPVLPKKSLCRSCNKLF